MEKVHVCIGQVYEKGRHYYARCVQGWNVNEIQLNDMTQVYGFIDYIIRKYKSEHLGIADISGRLNDRVLLVLYGSGVMQETYFEKDGEFYRYLGHNNLENLYREYLSSKQR